VTKQRNYQKKRRK